MTPDILRKPISSNHFVAQALSRDLDRLVLIGVDGERVTAGDMRDAVSRLQQLFESLEPKPRRAAILAKNRVELVFVSNAFSFAEIVTTTLHPMGSLEDYLYVLNDAEIDTLVYDADRYETTVQDLKARAPQIRHFLSMGDSEIGENVMKAAQRFTPRQLEAPLIDPTAMRGIAYSGGTTGSPKGIMVTHQSIVTSTILQLTDWEWPHEIRHLICAPLSHAGASVLNPILMKGGHMVVMEAFNPLDAMRLIEEHRITSVLMVPTMVISMLDHPQFGEFDLSSLEVVFYGASAFPVARLKDAIEKLGPIFMQFYGQAEAPMSISVMRRKDHDLTNPERLAGCGRPTSLAEVALLDDDLNEVPDGEPGEICVRGPLVMGGYLNKAEQTEEVFKGGWLHTGDVAVRSADGFLRIVDRKKDMIISGGFNVYAREVEDVIVDQPGVRQAAVIGVPDPKWGEAVKAVVVIEPGASISADEIIAAVRARKGAIHAPKTVDFVDALPLTAIGKPDKKALRQRYRQETAETA